MILRMSALFLALSFVPSMVAVPQGNESVPVLLIVSPGSEVSHVEMARAAVPASIDVLLVGETERVALKGGIELVVDRTFANAPPADVLVLLAGEPGGAEEFLLARRGSARAILLPAGLPTAKRLKERGSKGALILVGGVESLPALFGAVRPTAPSEPPAAATRTPSPPSAAPPITPTRPQPKGGVFDRYFSSGSRASTPSPTPR